MHRKLAVLCCTVLAALLLSGCEHDHAPAPEQTETRTRLSAVFWNTPTDPVYNQYFQDAVSRFNTQANS